MSENKFNLDFIERKVERQGIRVRIAVIDGLGGGLGSRIINSLSQNLDESVEIIALGTNSQATSRMINNGASRGATGENAIKFTVDRVDIIIGPVGIIIPNSMSGEITLTMAGAIASCSARIYLIGIKQPHVNIIGLEDISMNTLIDKMIEEVEEYIS